MAKTEGAAMEHMVLLENVVTTREVTVARMDVAERMQCGSVGRCGGTGGRNNVAAMEGVQTWMDITINEYWPKLFGGI